DRVRRRGRPGERPLAGLALATCAELPEGDDDAAPLIEALARRGVEAVSAVWDDETVDWSRFDLVVVRSAWDYAERRDDFLAWAWNVPHVLNPLEVLRWTTDKGRYLADLARVGVPVAQTTLVAPGQDFEPPERPFVVKPSVSAGGRSSGRFEPAEAGAAR